MLMDKDVRGQGLWRLLSTLAVIGFIVSGLFAWRLAPKLASMWAATGSRNLVYAIRLGAVAWIAAAQLVLLGLVIDGIYRRDSFSQGLKVLSGVVLVVCLISAAALAVAGGK